jgi:hypothetical protein
VLDEAQDLSELWVLAVVRARGRDGRWYAFADGQQDLFDADAALPDFLDVQHELARTSATRARSPTFAALVR